MTPFAPNHGVVVIRPPPQPGTREAADLAALHRSCSDLLAHLAVCEVASRERAAAAAAISVRVDMSGAPIAPQTLALALSVAGGTLEALGALLSSVDATAE